MQSIYPVLFICSTSQGFERLDHYEARFQLEKPDEQPYCRPTNLTKRVEKVATHIKSEVEPIQALDDSVKLTKISGVCL